MRRSAAIRHSRCRPGTNYVHAAIQAAARRLAPGQDAHAEIAAVAAFTVAGVRALAPTSSQS